MSKRNAFQKNTLCHSFCISVIPSVLLSFLPDYCHSFWIIVIPSRLLSFLSGLVSFLPNIVIPSKLFRELQILTSSKSFLYPKGEKNGHRRWPYMRVLLNYPSTILKKPQILICLSYHTCSTYSSLSKCERTSWLPLSSRGLAINTRELLRSQPRLLQSYAAHKL